MDILTLDEMTALDAFNEILDINEAIEMIKEKNINNQPDLALCRSLELLEHYRGLLGDALKNVKVFPLNS